jgi:hypothetical protein
MPDIRYVCLSDLHFGAETSILTKFKQAGTELDYTEPTQVLRHLVQCLRYLISNNNDRDQKPTLVLNGDIFELALAGGNEAIMTFERFIDLILPQGDELFGRIILNPGNHDHHLWEIARETQYIEYISTVPWGQEIAQAWHASNIFKKTVQAYSLNRLIQRLPHLKTRGLEISYPNFGVLSDDRQRCVIFHHGHFVESMYTLISAMKVMVFPGRKMPAKVWDIENENFAWIDFFWSALGRSGEAGEGVEAVYEKLQSEKQVKKLLANLASGLAKKHDLPGWGDTMEAKLLEWAFVTAADKIGGLERNQPENILSDDAETGLKAYLEGPLRQQVLGECDNLMPSRVTFVFGHTHKPFQRPPDKRYAGYPQGVDLYNTGGWVVDKVERKPLYGAAAVLLDENLNATSLRMYNEAEHESGYTVSVQEARRPGGQPGKFHQRIEALVSSSPSIWQGFSTAVAAAVKQRARNLRERIGSAEY